MDNRYQRDADGAKKMATICASAETLAEDLGPAFDGTVYYIDVMLKDNRGHYANACRHFTGELRERDIPVEILLSHYCEQDLLKELGGRPFFVWNDQATTMYSGVTRDLDMARVLVPMVRANLNRLPKLSPKDLIYVNSVESGFIMGLFDWLYRTFTPSTMPQVVLEFGYDMGIKLAAGSNMAYGVFRGPLYRVAVRSLPEPYWKRIRLYSFQSRCAQEYADYLGRAVGVFPYPQLPPSFPRFRSTSTDRSLVIGFLGQQSPMKGYPLVPDLVMSLLERYENIHVVIHDSAPNLNKQVADVVKKLAELDPRVIPIFSPAVGRDWWNLMERIDLLVLPYVKERYQDAYSAILAEAISSGLPVVAPSDTALSELMDSVGMPGVLFDHWGEAPILAAIEDAIARFDDLAYISSRAAISWMRSNGPQSLVDELLYGRIPRPEPALDPPLKIADGVDG
jgi:glycosyltransferase involved in cell wall biosynthesis